VTSFDVRGFLVCAEAAGVVWSEDLLGKCRLAAGWYKRASRDHPPPFNRCRSLVLTIPSQSAYLTSNSCRKYLNPFPVPPNYLPNNLLLSLPPASHLTSTAQQVSHLSTSQQLTTSHYPPAPTTFHTSTRRPTHSSNFLAQLTRLQKSSFVVLLAGG
jgi:hypothetical protein